MAPQRDTGSGAEAELPEYAGQYRLESCLGSGGMGVVHLATSTSGLRLAVKVVHAEFAKDPEFRGRFRQEVAAARQVSGAFTAPVVDADTDSARPWMATLFIPGPTLAEHVKRNGPMPPGQLRRLMAGLAEALRDIHRAGVVHRDLKPSNVLLAEDGPKVIDFGISRPKDSELRTETGKLIGTPPFMAPEQFRRPREVGPAADIFALGSVTVHAATGRGPFDSDSPYVVAYQVVHDEPDLTGVPENLAPLVRDCLAKEPEDRPTADELMHRLRSVAASYDTQAFIPAQREKGPGGERAVRDSPAEKTSTGPDGTAAGERDGGQADAAPGRGERGRPRRRVLVVATALVLAAGGVLGSVRLLGDDGDTAAGGPATPRATVAAAPALEAWATRPAPKKSGAPQCAYGAGTLVCAQPGLVSALDPADGRVLWRHPVTGDTSEPPVVSGGLVHVSTDGGGRSQALDPETGEVRWERDLTAYGGRRFVGGVLLLTSADGTVTGLDGATGDTLWRRAVPGQREAYFTSFGGGGPAYVASVTGTGAGARTRVTAVDPETGDVEWDARLDGDLKPVGASGSALFLLAGGGVYGDTVGVVRHDPASGTTDRFTLPVRLEQALAVVRGDRVCLLGIGGALVTVDMKAGRQLWRAETGVAQGSAPVTDGRYVYFTTADGRLLALDAREGRLAGQTPPRLGDTDRVVAALPTPVVVDGRVLAGAPDGTVFAVDAGAPAGW
ncbi:serine/threonine-protein kinase [Streptomyces heilongjiangensis]|uniref:PQQ-binding-like beta-propeller repeat protein n=1 Tax=Streptomyces heilongjiangensis TaxID=945052 RepID=A0ABW1BDX7_9ACTN|nr:serine/threonine-protein kinase [Streptomyces heilongjiangensis]MDC2949429.1 serine/threonine-protein kinase [Streptomyces heilongjiangensis]